MLTLIYLNIYKGKNTTIHTFVIFGFCSVLIYTTNSKFLISISLQPDILDILYFDYEFC